MFHWKGTPTEIPYNLYIIATSINVTYSSHKRQSFKRPVFMWSFDMSTTTGWPLVGEAVHCSWETRFNVFTTDFVCVISGAHEFPPCYLQSLPCMVTKTNYSIHILIPLMLWYNICSPKMQNKTQDRVWYTNLCGDIYNDFILQCVMYFIF